MHRRRIPVASLAATMLAFACSVYTAESPPVGVAPDASDDAAIAPSDASTSDAAIDADSRRFCEKLDPKPTYCRDFDDGAPLFFGFDRHEAPNGVSIAFDPSVVSTAPSSFLITLPAGQIPFENGFYIVRAKNEIDFGQAAQSVELAFALRIDDFDEVHTLRTAQWCMPMPTDGYWCLWLELTGDRMTVREQAPSDAGGNAERYHLVGLPFPLGKWTRVEMAIAVGSTRSFALKFDGYDAKPADVADFIIPMMTGGTFGLNAVVYGQDGDVLLPTKIRYDDVVVNLTN